MRLNFLHLGSEITLNSTETTFLKTKTKAKSKQNNKNKNFHNPVMLLMVEWKLKSLVL